MASEIERAIFTVGRHGGLWAVEHDGRLSDHSKDFEVAKAAAHRHARQAHDEGRPSKVRVSGDLSFFGP